MALLYDKVVSVVSKQPEERTDTEIEQILPWFRKKSELFNSQKSEIVKDILKNCQFMTCNRDHVIITQGEKGDCFYIILSGSVAIYIQTSIADDSVNHGQKSENRDTKEDQWESSGQKVELDRNIFGNLIGSIPAGRSFGELALINADCVRNASIIADETTDLIIVNRDLYNRSLKAFQEKEFDEKKRFVEEFSLFQGWHTRYKKQMSMSLRKKKINFDGIIIKQGTAVDGLCFLLSGQAKMLVDPFQHVMQYQDKFPLPDIAELEKVEARESIRREMNMAVPRTEEKKLIYQGPRSPNPLDRKRPHKNLELCSIGAVEIIGDMEMIFNLSTYAGTSQCTEVAEVFVLDQKNYERLIEKRNPQSIDIMRGALHEKLKLRMSWMQNEELPLFRYFLYKLDERKRNEINKLKELNRKRDITATIDYWKSGKLFGGPLIDQFGPGSVFYTIRMRARSKQSSDRNHQTAKAVNKNNSGAYLVAHVETASTKPNENAHTNNTAHGKTKNVTLPKTDTEGNYASEYSEEDLDMDICDGPQPNRSKVLCENTNSNKITSNHSNNQRHPTSRSSCSVNDFMNPEVNNLTLSRLESKIEEWHSKVNNLEDGRSSRFDRKHLVRLHRYSAEENKKPFPGKKIILRPRAPPKPSLLSLHLQAFETEQYSPTPQVVDENSNDKPRECTSRDQWSDEADIAIKSSSKMRPQSSKSDSSCPFLFFQQRPKSARQYTVEEYVCLKQALRHKQRTYKSMLTRTNTSFD